MVHKPIIIAGPCSAESDEQMDIAFREAGARGVDFVRVNLWKPRDIPAFDGLKEKGLYQLSRAAQAGLNPGMEVMFADHVTMAMEATLPHLKPDGKLLVWIGARNQNHFFQKEVGRLAAQDPRVWIMVKNQPWLNDKHWEGIIAHVMDGGFPKERILNCYRGVSPSPNDPNPMELRNIVDLDSAITMKQKTGVPMIFDLSHTGGSVPNVFKMGEQAAPYDFDGILVEVHHDPEHALTDSKQQITWQQFDELRAKMGIA